MIKTLNKGNNMFKWGSVLALSLVAMMGCNSTDSKSDVVISAGTYQYKISATDGSAIVQWQFNADGTYLGKTYFTSINGSIDCQTSEGKGDWTATAVLLKTTNRMARDRDYCDSAFSAWVSRPDANFEIRNASSSSIEIFQVSDPDSPASWLKFQKL
jgi:hypothetical protein